MKRKRGHRKGKPKKPPVVGANEAFLNVVSLNMEDNSGFDDLDNAEFDSGMEVETPSSTGTDQQEKLAIINPAGSIDKPVGKSAYGRVKVKLKTSKMFESQLTPSDAPTQSDTDKSSQQVGLEKQGLVTEKMEDSANSLPEIKIAVSGNPSKKAGSIKIKSSRGLGSSSVNLTSNSAPVQGERTQQKEPKLPHQDPQYNKQELNAALAVIKKVMKMDAAEPFNAPVNPVALGIPDYFDVIDTPMDFGTICGNLESGVKYMNSEDVFKDVQYIWENCYKYNNKGDYILDLMKRVKKNFAKYWTAAGLYSEQPRRTNDVAIDQDSVVEGLPLEGDPVRDNVLEATGRKTNMMTSKEENVVTSSVNGFESIQVQDFVPYSQGKIHVKGGNLKHKKRKRHGIKRHKEDCLCAVCIMRRRRLEREENAHFVEDQIGTSDGNMAQEFRREETSLVESPCGEDTSSNMDNSLDPDADDELEENGGEVKLEVTDQKYSPRQEKQENEMETQKKGEGENSEQSQLGDRSGEEPNPQTRTQIVEDSGGGIQTNTQREEISVQHEEEASAVQQQKHKESQEKHQKTKMYEKLLRVENPMLLELCGTLFSDNPKSVWSGPHALVFRQGSNHSSSIHAAIATLMK